MVDKISDLAWVTPEQLFRELEGVRLGVTAHSDSNRAVMESRIDGMSKAVEVFQADLTRVPTQLDRAITGLRELLESKITGVGQAIFDLHRDVDRATDRRTVEIHSQIENLRSFIESKIVALSAINDQKVPRYCRSIQ